MKQATGNNTAAARNDVSIQFNLGGHSFSASDLPAEVVAGTDDVLFTVCTHKVTLVPQEAFDEALSAQYLAVAGLACSAGETTVCSEMRAATVAVMAIDAALLDKVLAILGTRAKFTSPLLDKRHDEGRNLSIVIADDTAYYRLFDGSLRLAEAIRLQSADDVLFYALQFVETAGLGNDTDIYIRGSRSATRLLKRYFKRVVCE